MKQRDFDLLNQWSAYSADGNAEFSSGQRNCISLFSGALGMDLGLHAAGFMTKAALDIDKSCKETALKNFPEFTYLLEDIQQISADKLLSAAQTNKIDLLAGGPPCQPFSKSGLRKGLGDKRGNLFVHYTRLLEDIKPRAFVLENVRGIMSSNKGKDFENILTHLEETGYTVFAKVLDAANYGVPQFRQRLFIVGFKDKIDFSFPEETHSDYFGQATVVDKKMMPLVSLEEAFKGLTHPGSYPEYRGRYASFLAEIPEGLNYSYYCKERGHPNPKFAWRSKFWYFLLKAARAKPSLTIQAQPGNNTGPFHWDSRRFGVNELKRIQTIPDWYKIDSSYFVAHKLIGNAVPSLLAFRLGNSISDALNKKKPLLKNKNRIMNGNGNTHVKSYRGSGKGRLVVENGKAQLLKEY